LDLNTTDTRKGDIRPLFFDLSGYHVGQDF
jgi:hypothetical protein